MILINKKNHTEGAGSLYQEYITGWIICKIFNRKYIHKPPTYIRHFKSNNCTLEEFIRDWELIFSFLNDGTINIIDDNQIEEKSTGPDVISKLDSNKPYYINNCKQIFDNISTLFDLFNIKTLLRKEFHQNIKYKPQEIFWNKEYYRYGGYKNIINIALHLRNLNDEDIIRDKRSRKWEYFTFNYGTINKNSQVEYYKTLMKKINDLVSDWNKNSINNDNNVICHFHIFSQGSENDFEGFHSNNMNVFIHLNNYAPDVFLYFTKADILIIGKSSFSYLASLLNNNIKIMKNNFRHSLPSETVILNDNHKTIENDLKDTIVSYLNDIEIKENRVIYDSFGF